MKIKFKIPVRLITILIVFVVSFLIIYLVNEVKLNEIRKEKLEELNGEISGYDEYSIVLTNTNKKRAEELAEILNAELRITSDGSFGTLTLKDQTIKDVFENDNYINILDELSVDYEAKITELEEVEEEFLPSKPNKTVTEPMYNYQTYIDYINIGDAWNNMQSGITIAVIDTGIDTDHVEFSGKISKYSYNASTDQVLKDTLLEDGTYDYSIIEDVQGHGTMVSGVIAASLNETGITGIAPYAEILTIKAECDENGVFKRTSDLVFGLYYAIERDVNIVNMSFGTYMVNNPFKEPAKLAVDSDIICVAADENVIGVGALGSDSFELAYYSNFGENNDVVAPGTVYTTSNDGYYTIANGTSFASPIVAAAIKNYCIKR